MPRVESFRSGDARQVRETVARERDLAGDVWLRHASALHASEMFDAGRLGRRGDVDFLAFDATATAVHDIAVVADGPVTLSVFDPEGFLMQTLAVSDGGRGVIDDFRAEQTGVHHLAIASAGPPAGRWEAAVYEAFLPEALTERARAERVGGTTSRDDDLVLVAPGVVRGRGGEDRLTGSNADDRLLGGPQGDVLIGRTGDDDLLGGGGADRLVGLAGADELSGGGGRDVLRGGRDRDSLAGGRGADRLFGQGDDDLVFGGAGDDTLTGGRGDDVLEGGRGDDLVIGGPGRDAFLIGAGEGRDVWRGFRPGEDAIVITSGAEGVGDVDLFQRGDDVLARFADVEVRIEGVTLEAMAAVEIEFLF